MEGNFISLRNWTIVTFLENLIFFEPLNLFLYTWVLLGELQQDEQNIILKGFYKWFKLISIFIVPLAFCSIVPAFLMEYSLYGYAHNHAKF